MMQPLLLDTCAALWLVQDKLSRRTLEHIQARLEARLKLQVSPITAWEMGMLAACGRLQLTTGVAEYFRRILAQNGVELAPLPPEAMIAASFLPGEPPRDPADRILAACARELGYTLLTRDRALLAYAAAGHLRALAC